jgi:hypothetical protein
MTYVQLDRARRRLAELDQLLGDVCGATVAGRRQLGAGLHGRPDLAAAERAGLVAEHIVSRVMPRRRPEPSQTWRTLLANHIGDFVSIDFFTVPSVASVSSSFWLCLPITAAWTAQQLVDAFPEQSAPAYLLWDRDQVYVRDTSQIRAELVEDLHTGATWHVTVLPRRDACCVGCSSVASSSRRCRDRPISRHGGDRAASRSSSTS